MPPFKINPHHIGPWCGPKGSPRRVDEPKTKDAAPLSSSAVQEDRRDLGVGYPVVL